MGVLHPQNFLNLPPSQPIVNIQNECFSTHFKALIQYSSITYFYNFLFSLVHNEPIASVK